MNSDEINFLVDIQIINEEKEKGNFYELWNEKNRNIKEIDIFEGYETFCIAQEETIVTH